MPDFPVDETVEKLVGGICDGDPGPLAPLLQQSIQQGMGFTETEAVRWTECLMKSVRQALAKRLRKHRLVVLPEEAGGWETEKVKHGFGSLQLNRKHAEAVVRAMPALFTGRIRPAYLVYGPPETVTPSVEDDDR